MQTRDPEKHFCGYCGDLLHVRNSILSPPGVVFCPGCGAIEDRPPEDAEKLRAARNERYLQRWQPFMTYEVDRFIGALRDLLAASDRYFARRPLGRLRRRIRELAEVDRDRWNRAADSDTLLGKIIRTLEER